MEIRAKISGNAVNRKTVSAKQGFYDSSQDIIIWDKNSQSKFAVINPGDSGEVSFSFSPPQAVAGIGFLIILQNIFRIIIRIIPFQEIPTGIAEYSTSWFLA